MVYLLCLFGDIVFIFEKIGALFISMNELSSWTADFAVGTELYPEIQPSVKTLGYVRTVPPGRGVAH